MRKVKASMTIFVSLLLICILTLLSTLLEVGRVYGLRSIGEMNALSVNQSLFSKYQEDLYKRYDVFYLDCGGEGEMSFQELMAEASELSEVNLGNANTQGTSNFYKEQLELVDVQMYQLATDEEGAVFRKQAAQAMKQSLGEDAVNAAKDFLLQGKAASDAGEDMDEVTGNAQKALREAKEIKAEQEAAKKEAGETPAEMPETENPIEVIKEIKQRGILSLVYPEEEELSTKEVNKRSLLINRERDQGTGGSVQEDSLDKVLFVQYIAKHFGNGSSYEEDGALNYEMEYILGGKEKDKDNLKAVVRKLLVIREGANYLYLLSDATKTAQAYELAASIAGFTANPAIVTAVELGILAAWAYAESIVDVRTLLGGGKIPLVKTEATFQMDVNQLGSCLTLEAENEEGMTYQQYLEILLFVMNDKKLNLRTLSMMEANLRLWEEEESIAMDHMVSEMEIAYRYGSEPIFFSFVQKMPNIDGVYTFTQKEKISYCPED